MHRVSGVQGGAPVSVSSMWIMKTARQADSRIVSTCSPSVRSFQSQERLLRQSSATTEFHGRTCVRELNVDHENGARAEAVATLASRQGCGPPQFLQQGKHAALPLMAQKMTTPADTALVVQIQEVCSKMKITHCKCVCVQYNTKYSISNGGVTFVRC